MPKTKVYLTIHNKALVGHLIKNLTLTLGLRSSCRGQCTLEDNCVSYNIGPPIKDQVSCQLSDSDHVQHPDDLVTREGFMYQSSEVRYFNPYLSSSRCTSTKKKNFLDHLLIFTSQHFHKNLFKNWEL